MTGGYRPADVQSTTWIGDQFGTAVSYVWGPQGFDAFNPGGIASHPCRAEESSTHCPRCEQLSVPISGMSVLATHITGIFSTWRAAGITCEHELFVTSIGFTSNTSLAIYCRDHGLLLHIHRAMHAVIDRQKIHGIHFRVLAKCLRGSEPSHGIPLVDRCGPSSPRCSSNVLTRRPPVPYTVLHRERLQTRVDFTSTLYGKQQALTSGSSTVVLTS